MKIKIKDIPDSGALTIEEKLATEELDLGEDALLICGPVQVKASIFKSIDNVTVGLLITGSLQLDCSRCLKKYTLPFKKTAQFNYDIKPTDLVIDLSSDLREEIILDFPIKPLCKSDCLGLCLKCGEDLNLGKCACQ